MPPETTPVLGAANTAPQSTMDFLGDVYPDDDDLAGLDRGDDAIEGDEVPEPIAAPEPEADPAPEPEPEADPAPEPEADPAPEADPTPEPEPVSDKRITVPKSRLDSEIAKRRLLEEQVATLTKAQKKVETTEAQDEAFTAALAEADALFKQANEAVLDGEFEKAATLQREALVKVTSANKAAVPDTADPEDIVSQIEARIELKSTLKDIYTEFPMLDNNNTESLDEELLERAMQYEGMYAQQGYTPAEAVRRGVDDAVKLLRPELLKKADPVVEPVAPVDTTAQEARSNPAVKAGLAGKQPPPLPKGTSGEPEINLATLSDEEFDALPESTKAKLRGDF